MLWKKKIIKSDRELAKTVYEVNGFLTGILSQSDNYQVKLIVMGYHFPRRIARCGLVHKATVRQTAKNSEYVKVIFEDKYS